MLIAVHKTQFKKSITPEQQPQKPTTSHTLPSRALGSSEGQAHPTRRHLDQQNQKTKNQNMKITTHTNADGTPYYSTTTAETKTKNQIKKMKITIRHDQSSIDPSATYTDEQFAQVKKSLEREYTKAILAEYPDAEIEFEESTDTKSIVVKTSGLDDPSEIEDNIQRILETVFETGLFWL
jgi:hypothetical protein